MQRADGLANSSFRAYFKSSKLTSAGRRTYHLNFPVSSSSSTSSVMASTTSAATAAALPCQAQNKSQSVNNLATAPRHPTAESQKSPLLHLNESSQAAVSEPSVNVVDAQPGVEVRSTPVVSSLQRVAPSLFTEHFQQPQPQQQHQAAVSSSSSAYFPLEPTMEECIESLDISYEAANSLNDLVAATSALAKAGVETGADSRVFASEPKKQGIRSRSTSLPH